MERMPWWNDADEAFDDIAGHLNALNARMVVTARWLLDNPTEWQGDGVWTPEAYICWRTGIARATASKIVDIARRSADLPETIATMRRGELSLDQVAPIARHAPGWADHQISRLAPQLLVTQISRIVRAYPWNAEDGPPDSEPESGPDATVDGPACPSSEYDVVGPPAAIEPDDRASYSWGDDGRFRLSLDVGADTGNLLESALEECHDRLFHERTDTDSIAVVDAVTEMAARSIDAIPTAARRSRFRTNVHLETSTGRVTDRRGRPVAVGPAQRMTCDTLVTPVRVLDGVPVSVGRSQHIVPDRTRRLVEHRDGGCRVPGCHSDRFIEVHHIVHWSHGGCTNTSNLLSLCSKHHRLHHQGKLDIVGDGDRPAGVAGAVEFRDRHGRPIRPSGASPNPPAEPRPPLDGTYRHPLGERLDPRDLHFHETTTRRP